MSWMIKYVSSSDAKRGKTRLRTHILYHFRLPTAENSRVKTYRFACQPVFRSPHGNDLTHLVDTIALVPNRISEP